MRINQLLNTYGLTLNDDVKSMYDGYKIGSIDIYNPWSILNYAQKKSHSILDQYQVQIQ